MEQDHFVFTPVIQKSTNDCGIACLEMLLGVPYTTVRGAAGRRLTKAGMSTRAIINTAKILGTELVMQKDFDEEDIGIVDLVREDNSDGHVVVFMKGCVWTTAAGQLWTDLHVYCKTHNFRVLGLLTRRGVDGE